MSLKELHLKYRGQGLKTLAFLVLLIYWGYNTFGHFFTVELKVTSGNKIRFSPHQISHSISNIQRTLLYLPRSPVRAPSNCFQVPVSWHLSKTDSSHKTLAACRLMLVACIYLRLMLDACCLSACNLRLWLLVAWCLSLEASLIFWFHTVRVKVCQPGLRYDGSSHSFSAMISAMSLNSSTGSCCDSSQISALVKQMFLICFNFF